MKTNVFLKTNSKTTSFLKLLVLLLFFSVTVKAQTLPYEISNTSDYPDDEVFIAIVGITDGHVWVDPISGQVNNMDPSINTVQGPVIGGNQGPGLDGKYADCFRRLSDIPNKTVQIPKIAGCRIMISFKSQLYLYFFGHSGAPSGYAAPNLENPTDPNQGIKFELIELTFNDIGLWCNTSRVDAYQYPMGLEVWGDGFYKKVGELKNHNEILDEWRRTAPGEFQSLLNESEGSIHFPTKVASFPNNFMDGYINDIWSKYSSQELAFTSDAGIWRGSVQGNNFVFRRDSDGQIGTIFGKPTTIEAMEGSGVMASGDRWDLVVQSQMVAAITRHAVDLNMPSGALQNFGDSSKYYQTWPYNWYSKFFHRTDISFESQTYTFAYDDVYDQSATIHTPNPTNIKITLGKIDGNSTPDNPPVRLYLDCPFSGTAVGLSEGSYTMTQLAALGIPNDNVSSLRVQPGYKATLYWDDNFSGASLVKTSDDSC
ncbi:glycoside hydrolase family 64 protein, partial [Aquimarina sp. M1]